MAKKKTDPAAESTTPTPAADASAEKKAPAKKGKKTAETAAPADAASTEASSTKPAARGRGKKAASDSESETAAPAPAADSAKPQAAAGRPAASPAPASAAKKGATGKKSAPVPATAATKPAGVPLIDTDLAAQNAATMLRNRSTLAPAQPPAAAGGAKPESAAFKNLKEQLAKPKPASLGVFGVAGGGKKGSGGPSFLNQAKGHNQTYGGFNKTGVPRRTNG